MTHNNDPITIPSLPPPLLIGVSDDRVKGADGTTPLEDSDQRWSYVLAQESIDIIDELRQEVRAAHNKFQWETVAAKPPHQELCPEDVPGLSAEEVTTLSDGYTAPLPQVRGFAMKQLDRVRTSFAGDQKQLHRLFVKLVHLPNESPGPVHRAVQRRLVPDDGILTSYTLVVGSHPADSTTNGYLIPFSSGGLPQPWNRLPFPTVAGESLICPSDCNVRLLGSAAVCTSRWSSLLWALGLCPLVSLMILVGSRKIAVAAFSSMCKRSWRHRLDKVRLGAKWSLATLEHTVSRMSGRLPEAIFLSTNNATPCSRQ